MKKKHIALIIIGIIFILLPAFHTNIWYDESYTVAMVRHSFAEIWQIGSNDVHPVLYYFMLKFINLLFGTNILLYRLFSVIPIVILGILGYTHIKKDFGEKAGMLFSFLIFFMPGLTRYTTEIRMYSWAMLFVTLTGIYAYRLYKDEFKPKNLVLFGIFSLAGAYTHYYGLMASGIINFMLFIYYLKNLREMKSEFFKFILCAIIQVALYIPWLMIFISQVTSVGSNGFWITISFPDTLIDLLVVGFSDNLVFRLIALIPVVILYGYIIFIIIKLKNAKENIKPGIFAIIVYLLVALAALIISLIMQPILLDRYLLVALGLLIFFIAYFLAKYAKKIALIIICSVIIVLSIANRITAMVINYSPSNNVMLEYIDSNIEEKDSFLIYNDEIAGFSISVRYPDNMQYFHDKCNWGGGGAYNSFGPNIIIENDINRIMEQLSGRVWVINAQEEQINEDITSKYDVKIIERKEFQTRYNGYFFSFTLIEK